MRLTTGVVLMIRHRARNYDLALRDKRASDTVIAETRRLFVDMLGVDVILELSDLWLAEQERKRAKRKAGASS